MRKARDCSGESGVISSRRTLGGSTASAILAAQAATLNEITDEGVAVATTNPVTSPAS